MAGIVRVDGERCDKAGRPVAPDAKIDVLSKTRWVSRGAEKLLAAFDRFGLSCDGQICLDIGAGSGGFTQVLLERGARRVYAVDVGYGQFDAKLRANERVVLLERKNARTLTSKDITDSADFFSMDVSFISIFKILPAIVPLLSPQAVGALLFKPNFEAHKKEVKKGGLLLDPAIHRRLLTDACCRLAAGTPVHDLAPSPIRGGDGNVEYLLAVSRQPASAVPLEKISAVVDHAFATGE